MGGPALSEFDTALGGCTYLGCIGVECPVIDVQTEVDNTSECNILICSSHSRIRKEEYHSHQRSNDHGSSSAPAPARAAQEASEDRTKDATCVGDGVVSPGGVWTVVTELGAAGLQVHW